MSNVREELIRKYNATRAEDTFKSKQDNPKVLREQQEVLDYNQSLKTKAVEDFPYQIYGNRVIIAPFKSLPYGENGMKISNVESYQDKDTFKTKTRTTDNPHQMLGTLVHIGAGVSDEFKEFFSVGDTVLIPMQIQPMIIDRRYHKSAGKTDEIFYVQATSASIEGKL